MSALEPDADEDLEDLGEGTELEPVSEEDRARAQGWRPYDEYRGDPRKWTPAREYLAKGESEWPVMRDNNRRMGERLVRQDAKIEGLQRTIAEQADAVKSAVELARRADDRGYQRARDEMKARQREAVEAADTEAFDQIGAEIDALERTRAEQVKAPEPVAPEDAAAAPPRAAELPAETRQFIADNRWFNDKTRPYLRDACIGFERAEMNRDPAATLTERFEVVLDKMRVAYPEIDEEEEVVAQPPRRDAFRRRAAPSAEPTGAPIARRRSATGSPIDTIADPKERGEARAAFENIKRGLDGEYTEAEYMAVYDDPHADVLDVMKQQRKK